jgi:hypothetical protein
MRKLLPIFIAVALGILYAGCGSSKFNHGVPKQYYTQFKGGQTVKTQAPLKKDSTRYSPSTLIIYYDQQVGKKELLKAVKEYGATILYQYNNFNGIAISIPKGKTLDESILFFEKVKGVLSVHKDYIYKLD